MLISDQETKDIERYLGTLSTCEYKRVAPRLSAEDAEHLAELQIKFYNYIQEYCNG